jgi:hypothetical protein
MSCSFGGVIMKKMIYLSLSGINKSVSTLQNIVSYKKVYRYYSDLELIRLFNSSNEDSLINKEVETILRKRGYVYDHIYDRWESF